MSPSTRPSRPGGEAKEAAAAAECVPVVRSETTARADEPGAASSTPGQGGPDDTGDRDQRINGTAAAGDRAADTAPATDDADADDGARRRREAHRALLGLPTDTFLELPGRPTILYQLRDYSTAAGFAPPEDPACSRGDGARAAREDLPFLFRAFEAGHPPPPPPGSKEAEAPRASTIHEYLDWTVSAAEANAPDELVRA